MTRRFAKALSLLTTILVLAGCGGLRGPRTGPPTVVPTAAPVPVSYQQLYASLATTLAGVNTRLDSSLAGQEQHGVVLAAELMPANGNAGAALWAPERLAETRLYLDRLRELGVGGVKVSVPYPLLVPTYPDAARYLEFYREVAREVRQRRMVLTVQVGVVFANTPFSNVRVDYSALTFDQFERENRAMVQAIVKEMSPAYLVILPEPDTMAGLTGLLDFYQPARCVEYVRYILTGLDRGTTKVGAGSGTWSPTTFVRDLSAGTDVDFISLHVYPMDADTLARAYQDAALARENGKRLIFSEAWLYKASAPAGSVAANDVVFRRDVYSFWAPLDEQFISAMVKLADLLKADFLCFFWSPYLFSYLGYAPRLEGMAYGDLARRRIQAASAAVHDGHFTVTGTYYRDLIAARRDNRNHIAVTS